MQYDKECAFMARQMIADRDHRYSFFPNEIFDEFAWNMLLHLFVAMFENEQLSEARLCALARTSPAVGRRWLRHLVDDGQVKARDDGDDVVLTPASIARLRGYLSESAHAVTPANAPRPTERDDPDP